MTTTIRNLTPEDRAILDENNRDIGEQKRRSVPVHKALGALDAVTVDLSDEQLQTVWAIMDPAARVVFIQNLKRLLSAERKLPIAEINIGTPADDPDVNLGQ